MQDPGFVQKINNALEETSAMQKYSVQIYNAIP